MLTSDCEWPLTQLYSTDLWTSEDWKCAELPNVLDDVSENEDRTNRNKLDSIALIESIEAHANTTHAVRLNPLLTGSVQSLLDGMDDVEQEEDKSVTLDLTVWQPPSRTKFVAPPISVLSHLDKEKEFQKLRRLKGYSEKTIRTVLPKTPRGHIRVKNRKPWRLLGLDPFACYSSTLGVPPTKNPKKSASRSTLERRRQYNRISWCDVLTQLVEEQPRIDSVGQIRDHFDKLEYNVYHAGLDEQYDFMQTELRKNEQGELQPWGPIPGTNQMGWHQYRLQHALIYLLRREVLWILRPGPLGLDYPYVKYDWDYLQWIYYENGKDGVREALSANAFKIRFEILHPLVNQIFDIEGNGPMKRVKAKLPKINDLFCNGKLVFLDNGIGLLHPPLREGDQERASRLNAHVQECLGRCFFGWEGKNVIDPWISAKPKPKKQKRVASKETIAAQKKYEQRRTKGTKPIPANTLPRLFEAAYAAYSVQFPKKELMLPTQGLAAKEIALAAKRPHAAGLIDRKKRFEQKLETPLGIM